MLTFVILAIIFIAPTITVHIGREEGSARGGGRRLRPGAEYEKSSFK